MEYARTNGSISTKEVVELLQASRTPARRILDLLVRGKKLKPVGKGRAARYLLEEPVSVDRNGV